VNARVARVVATATVLVTFGGFGGTALAGTARADLPPATYTALSSVFDPLLRKIGLHTTRAALQSTRTYTPSSHGTHLAVYVEPTGKYTDADYVHNIARVVQLFVPMIFTRWKGLESFDVCQEPLPNVDPRPEPPPVTQVYVARAGLKGVSWKHVTLKGLLVAAKHHMKTELLQRQYSLYIDPRLDTQPDLVAARAASRTDTSTG
jgi:hypothetical protein